MITTMAMAMAKIALVLVYIKAWKGVEIKQGRKIRNEATGFSLPVSVQYY
jgi:hypothetical protein